jgi:hypothetical protein
MNIGDVVGFGKFDGGVINHSEGTLSSLTEEFAIISHEGKEYKFRRAPGPKSGYGIGPARLWRLGTEARSAL